MTSGINLSGTAVNGADTYTMSLSITPAADGSFEGLQSKKAIETLTMKKNGVVLNVTNIDAYFSINPLSMKGASYSDGSYAVQTSNTGAYPASAKVGDSGPQGTLTLYNSIADRTVKSTSQSSWTMEADTATTAFGCSNSILRNAAGAQTGTATGCYKIDANGNVLGMRYTLSVAGLTLVFK